MLFVWLRLISGEHSLPLTASHIRMQAYVLRARNNSKNTLKKSGLAGLFSASLELTREGLITIMQKKNFW